MSIGDGIMALPRHLRSRLASALDAGVLTSASSAATLRRTLGLRTGGELVLAELDELAGMGVTGRAAAAWLRTVDRASVGGSRTDLVWSGPTVPGVAARDTGKVFEETLRAAERNLWVSTYAYFDGPQVFGNLAQRLDSVAGLSATLLLNVQRGRGDTTARDQLVRRFADQFWTRDWPGASRPAVYYDPRALDGDGPGGVLHAKAVVADGVRLFVTSANLTEAAQTSNIELGVLLSDRTLAASVISHFQGLIDARLLQPLPPP